MPASPDFTVRENRQPLKLKTSCEYLKDMRAETNQSTGTIKISCPGKCDSSDQRKACYVAMKTAVFVKDVGRAVRTVYPQNAKDN